MKITNLEGSIIGESVPKVQFLFKDGDHEVAFDRAKLTELDTLSQGEKRALYLLNIIFDLEKIKLEKKEKLVIVDDIADSFDYKNKYAIMEYLDEISQESNIKMIILSHNYDFYRNVSMRLGVGYKRRYMANIEDNKIVLKVEKYQKNPFEAWKMKCDSISFIAMIPMLRNLIEYGADKKSCGDSDYDYLTCLLHIKDRSKDITIANIEELFNLYIFTDKKINLPEGISRNSRVIDAIISICDKMDVQKAELEHKIVLAMGIRLMAEKYMINRLLELDLNEGKGYSNQISNITGNQTNKLLKMYKKELDGDESLRILQSVNIMTPENIHLNSFMYEPLIDMDITELLTLYTDVKKLVGENLWKS